MKRTDLRLSDIFGRETSNRQPHPTAINVEISHSCGLQEPREGVKRLGEPDKAATTASRHLEGRHRRGATANES